MQKLSKKNKGLSTVITTLIILVVAVLLAGVVTYYATNVVMTRTTMEEIRIRKPHVWVQEGDNAYAALMVQNLGGRDVLIDKVTIRGVDAPWGGDEFLATATGSDLVYPISGPAYLAETPIEPGTIAITAIVSDVSVMITDTPGTYPAGVLAGTGVAGTVDYETGQWDLTFVTTGPDAGTQITASYIAEGAIAVQYYLVGSGDDVSGDFELKQSGGVVYAQIGAVPAAQGDWITAPSDMPLKSSGSMLFFITNPNNIALNDVGTTISITVYTSNAQWIVETNVEAAVIE